MGCWTPSPRPPSPRVLAPLTHSSSSMATTPGWVLWLFTYRFDLVVVVVVIKVIIMIILGYMYVCVCMGVGIVTEAWMNVCSNSFKGFSHQQLIMFVLLLHQYEHSNPYWSVCSVYSNTLFPRQVGNALAHRHPRPSRRKSLQGKFREIIAGEVMRNRSLRGKWKRKWSVGMNDYLYLNWEERKFLQVKFRTKFYVPWK